MDWKRVGELQDLVPCPFVGESICCKYCSQPSSAECEIVVGLHANASVSLIEQLQRSEHLRPAPLGSVLRQAEMSL